MREKKKNGTSTRYVFVEGGLRRRRTYVHTVVVSWPSVKKTAQPIPVSAARTYVCVCVCVCACACVWASVLYAYNKCTGRSMKQRQKNCGWNRIEFWYGFGYCSGADGRKFRVRADARRRGAYKRRIVSRLRRVRIS